MTTARTLRPCELLALAQRPPHVHRFDAEVEIIGYLTFDGSGTLYNLGTTPFLEENGHKVALFFIREPENDNELILSSQVRASVELWSSPSVLQGRRVRIAGPLTVVGMSESSVPHAGFRQQLSHIECYIDRLCGDGTATNISASAKFFSRHERVHLMTTKPPLPADHQISFHGMVSAVSSMLHDARKVPYFFMEVLALCPTGEDVSPAFARDIVDSADIGVPHLRVRLQLSHPDALMSHGLNLLAPRTMVSVRNVVATQSKHGVTWEDTADTRLESFRASIREENALHSVYDSLWDTLWKASGSYACYGGVISHVNQKRAELILDGKVRLFLPYTSWMIYGHGLRVGARLHVYHAPCFFKQCQYAPPRHMMPEWLRAWYFTGSDASSSATVLLAASVRTCIQVVEFSADVSTTFSSCLVAFRPLLRMLQQSTLPFAMLVLDIVDQISALRRPAFSRVKAIERDYPRKIREHFSVISTLYCSITDRTPWMEFFVPEKLPRFIFDSDMNFGFQRPLVASVHLDPSGSLTLSAPIFSSAGKVYLPFDRHVAAVCHSASKPSRELLVVAVEYDLIMHRPASLSATAEFVLACTSPPFLEAFVDGTLDTGSESILCSSGNGKRRRLLPSLAGDHSRAIFLICAVTNQPSTRRQPSSQARELLVTMCNIADDQCVCRLVNADRLSEVWPGSIVLNVSSDAGTAVQVLSEDELTVDERLNFERVSQHYDLQVHSVRDVLKKGHRIRDTLSVSGIVETIDRLGSGEIQLRLRDEMFPDSLTMFVKPDCLLLEPVIVGVVVSAFVVSCRENDRSKKLYLCADSRSAVLPHGYVPGFHSDLANVVDIWKRVPVSHLLDLHVAGELPHHTVCIKGRVVAVQKVEIFACCSVCSRPLVSPLAPCNGGCAHTHAVYHIDLLAQIDDGTALADIKARDDVASAILGWSTNQVAVFHGMLERSGRLLYQRDRQHAQECPDGLQRTATNSESDLLQDFRRSIWFAERPYFLSSGSPGSHNAGGRASSVMGCQKLFYAIPFVKRGDRGSPQERIVNKDGDRTKTFVLPYLHLEVVKSLDVKGRSELPNLRSQLASVMCMVKEW